MTQDYPLGARRGPKEGVLFAVGVARVLVWLWAILGVIGGVIIAIKTDESYYSGTTHPYVAQGLGAALVVLVFASFMLAVVEYMAYRVHSD